MRGSGTSVGVGRKSHQYTYCAFSSRIPMVLEIRAQSSSSSCPVRIRVWSTREREQHTHHDLVAGHLEAENQHRFSSVIAAFSTSSWRSGFPMDGRAPATILKSDGCRPAVFYPDPDNADDTPSRRHAAGIKFFDLLNGFFQESPRSLRTLHLYWHGFGDLEHPGFRQIEQILTGTPLRIITGIGDPLATEIISRITARSRTISA